MEPEAGFTNSGDLTLDPAATLDVPGDLLSTGDLWLGDGSSLDLSGAFLNQGDVHVADAAASISPATGTDNTGNLLLGPDGSLDLTGAVTSSGTVSLASGASLSATGPLLNDGEVLASGAGAVLRTGRLHQPRTRGRRPGRLPRGGERPRQRRHPRGAGGRDAGHHGRPAQRRQAPGGRDRARRAGGSFTQDATGLLRITVTDTGTGRVAAGGVRDLAGKLVLRLDTDASPPLGTRRALVTSEGRATTTDAFDVVRAPRRSGLTAEVRYRDNRVWLRVVDASA